MGKTTSSNYDIANAQNVKEPIIVLEIEDVPFVFSSAKVYTLIRYDDPGVLYDGTYVYDGLRPLDDDKQKNLIDRKGSFTTISQKLEQWDGKSSVETCNIKLVDENGIITQLVTPGAIVDEILNKKVKIWFGYKSLSFPEDYIRLFTGYINNYTMEPTACSFVFTDPSSKRKVRLFNGSASRLTTSISPVDTTIVMSSTSNLYQTITNALGDSDSGVQIGIVIEDEIILYENADISSGTTLINVTRGALGTTASSHDAGEEIKCFIKLTDNPINIALKTMLSGWNGPWISEIKLRAIVNDDNGGTIADSITFAQGVDITRDYGVTVGDFIITSGSGVPANNDTWEIESIDNDGRTAVVTQKGVLVQENPPLSGFLSCEAAFRSKYDVYPITAGLSLNTDDVNVQTHEYFRDTFIQFSMAIPVIADQDSGKTWIETELFKWIGAYSLTQGSRISMGLTRPPLVDDLTQVLDPSNIIDPKSVRVTRGLNNRFFYNVVVFQYDYDVIQDKYKKSVRYINADAIERMKQVSVLEIEVKGLNDSVESETILQQRAARILQRYQFGAETIEVRSQFGVGHLFDAGDIAILNDYDPPLLQISNTTSGARGVQNRVMEIQERSINLSDGTAKFRLLSNNGFDITDRYGVISPSSLIDETYSNTPSKIRIKPSFTEKFGTQEWRKWVDYVGQRLRIHDDTWTFDEEVDFTQDTSDPNIMNLTPALSFSPSGNEIVELSEYDDTSSDQNSIAKSQFCSLDPYGTIFSGTSTTVFTLDAGFSVKFQVGMVVYVQKSDYSLTSPDLKITNISGDIVTVGSVIDGGPTDNLGFTPSSGDLLQLGGFKDGGRGYRFI